MLRSKWASDHIREKRYKVSAGGHSCARICGLRLMQEWPKILYNTSARMNWEAKIKRGHIN
jgi:hypothetical protein